MTKQRETWEQPENIVEGIGKEEGRSAEDRKSATSDDRRAKLPRSWLTRDSGRHRSEAVGAEGHFMTIPPRPDPDSTLCWPGFPIRPGDPRLCAGEQPGRTSARLLRGERAVDLTAQGDNRPVGAQARTLRVG